MSAEIAECVSIKRKGTLASISLRSRESLALVLMPMALAFAFSYVELMLSV